MGRRCLLSDALYRDEGWIVCCIGIIGKVVGYDTTMHIRTVTNDCSPFLDNFALVKRCRRDAEGDAEVHMIHLLTDSSYCLE
jgi:hypothetical protein